MPPTTSDADAKRELTQVAWVRELALAVVRDTHLADDVAQDAWVAALRRPPAMNDRNAGWFVRVIRNLVRFRARSEARRTAHEQLGAGPAREEDPSCSLERLELQEELLRAVRELPEPYRTTVLQRWFEDFEPAEIARRAGVPESTVRTRMSRALALLRQHLDRRSGGDRSAWAVAWIPLLGRASVQPVSILAMNLKLKLAVASVLVLGLLTTAWMAIPAHDEESPQLVAMPSAPVVPERQVTEAPAVSAEPDVARSVIASEPKAVSSASNAAALLVRVRDAVGPVGRYAVRIVGAEHPDRLRGLEELLQDHPAGETSLSVSPGRFSVQLFAELHAPLVLGPFEKSPGTLDALLERRGAIRGHVLRAGSPVEDAQVSLREAVLEGRRTWQDGLLVRSYNDVAKGKSVSDGAFALTLQKPGRYWVRAALDGWADAELGPFDLDPNIGKDGLVLELTRGGSIEGRVLLPAGESLSEAAVYIPTSNTFGGVTMEKTLALFEVVATRGDGSPHRVKPDADGHFRIEGLMPGPWCVMRQPGVRQTENDDGPGYTPEYSNCEVMVGVVTQHDLDLRSGSGVKLAVSAEIGDAPCAGWKLRVASYGWLGTHLDGYQTLGADGRLEVDCTPGPAVLHITGSLGNGATMDVREQVTLEPGTATWTIHNAAGSLEGQLTGAAPLEKGSAIELRMEEGAQEFRATVRVGSEGRFQIEALPAGSWSAIHPSDRSAPAIPFNVGPRATTRVDLPW